eukprot:CAMPEP_0174233344 /NCGR_PEP_ID=MMETSP0417-20130205/3409_1 /TAXON_ID=242541 /ORGANISM="Mayorella sp, Strain BSH-02190019" /LENGTH=591 /DNA_ID=CAMNT_0015311541 /DNA_START=98 /DNA_END=1873 /DNA_ORIENTATION=-
MADQLASSPTPHTFLTRNPVHSLPKPHGGKLCELLLKDEALEALNLESIHYPSMMVTDRQECDLEMLLNGGFSPLTGFLNQEDYESVVENCRLANGTVWPMPITFDVSEAKAAEFKVGDHIALRNAEGNLLAVLDVESKYKPDKEVEAVKVFGKNDRAHPGVDYLFGTAGDWYLGGTIRGAQLPVHYDYMDIRRTPAELRAFFVKMAYTRVVGFQTRNPMHRSHRELTIRAATSRKATVLIHPVVGMTKPGDIDAFTRVRAYKAMLNHYPTDMATLSLLPLAMRMAGPREAVWHSIIRVNYGCTFFIVGRDHAGPGPDSEGNDFYGAYDAQVMAEKYAPEIGIEILTFSHMVYVPERAEYRTLDELEEGMVPKNISGTELRRRLYLGISIPEWFSYPDVVAILRSTYRPREKQGFTVFFTGLSGSGKTTLANSLRVRLLQEGSRSVELLDGDVVRTHLSSELGFSKEHRDLNIRRMGFVASCITKAGGVAICCAIAPYRGARQEVKKMVEESGGGFILVHVSSPLSFCEGNDVKGLYKKARAGMIKGFTGIDDPYEEPSNPDITIDASQCTVRQGVMEILLQLEMEGYMMK